jgi:hypothetical protein
MEAAGTTETTVNLYQNTRHINPEDSHLHICRHENLKSHNTVPFHTFPIQPSASIRRYITYGGEKALLNKPVVNHPNS